jgi:hypothetical protein
MMIVARSSRAGCWPTAQLVTHWRSVVQARDAARRVDLLLSQFDEAPGSCRCRRPLC